MLYLQCDSVFNPQLMHNTPCVCMTEREWICGPLEDWFNSLPPHPPWKNMTRMRCKGPYKVAIYFIKSIKYCKISQRNEYTLIGTTFGSFLANEHQSIFDIQPCKRQKLEVCIEERFRARLPENSVSFYFWPHHHHVHTLSVSNW